MGIEPGPRGHEEWNAGPNEAAESIAESATGEQSISLDDANYADKVLYRAIREATEMASGARDNLDDAYRADLASIRSYFRSSSRPRGAAVRNYGQSVRKALDYLPAWPFGIHDLQVGDIGVIQDEIFVRTARPEHLLDTVVVNDEASNSEVRLQTGRVHLQVREEPSARESPPDDGNVRPSLLMVRLWGEGTLFAHWQTVGLARIDNMQDVIAIVRDMDVRGRWSPDWVLVSKVIRARSGVVLMSAADDAYGEFRVWKQGAGGGRASYDPFDALNSGSLELVGSSGLAASAIALEEFTPCFGALRLRRGLLSGSDELVNVMT